MERVISQLAAFGIEPEAAENSTIDKQHASELLSRVKLRAAQIIESRHDGEDPIDLETVQAALDPKRIVPQRVSEKSGPIQMVLPGMEK